MKIMTKKRIMIDVVILVIALGAIAIYFFNFTPNGRLMTISSQGFTYREDSIYVDDNFKGSLDDIKKMITNANKRVENFFGGLESTPTYIISDDSAKLEKLGWSGNPAFATTKVLLGVHTFIIITPDGIDLDIISHELSHAELHSRLYSGKMFLFRPKIPTWFDEGLAIQNDYRTAYNVFEWRAITKNGTAIPPMDKIASPSDFFQPDENVRQQNYILSKFEVSSWLKANGKERLHEVIDGVRMGDSFEELYNEKPETKK